MIRRLLLAACLLAFAPAAQAQTDTLARLHERGRIVIGYADDDFPFSFARDGHPEGYAVDLCRGVIDELSRAAGKHLGVEAVPLAADARLAAVRTGRVDLDCAASVPTADRHRAVAFSPIIFVAGTSLLARRGTTLHSFRDLDGKTVAVIAGTPAEAAIRYMVAHGRMDAKIVAVPDLDQAVAMLGDRRVDALAGDDVVLHRLIARGPAAHRFVPVGGLLSHQPYAIMFAKDDPALADAVGRAFARMAQHGDLAAIYDRWFDPGVPALRLPISPQLNVIFHMLANAE
jgi:glutamate/aspartate transport system substrate-binding protein